MGRDQGSGRGFREVDISITSVQPGVDRSGRQEENASRIYPAYWRNNLTGLSQHANLYFVAVLDQIHVYQPDFPTQRLQKRIFAWRVAATNTGHHGFICPGHPHWINRLAIGDYGTEEVLATAHDQGDFIVCTVRSICQAIEAYRAFALKPQEAADRYIKYMCRRNVSASAWGIAIHQNARLLAVSANTKHVTVFAPALVDDSKRSDAPSNIADRVEDKGYLLAGHDANIPCIAFCNTDEDRDGRFLVSADINGVIIIWDIWKQCGLKKIAMSIMPEPGFVPRDGENFLGWSVTCVDQRSFRSTNRDVEFVGYLRPDTKKSAAMVDISPARKDLRDFQFWHEPETQQASGRDELFLRPDSAMISNNLVDGNGNRLGFRAAEDTDGPGLFDDDGDYEDDDIDEDEFLIQAARELDSDFDPFGDDVPDSVWQMLDRLEESETDDFLDNPYDAIDFGPSAAPRSNLMTEAAIERSDSASESTTSLPASQPLASLSILDLPSVNRQPPFAPHARENLTQRSRIQSPPPPAPKPPPPNFPFSIIHSGKRIVTLLRPPFDNAATVCIDPCHEHLPPEVLNLGSFERLNLTAYIPELGVAIIATQKGRAAIFTLTTLPPGANSNEPGLHPLKSSSRRDPSSEESSESAVRHALRLDWVLPFKSQENRKDRPWSPLLGIATAPVQGSQTRRTNSAAPDERSDDIFERFGGDGKQSVRPQRGRWRLFLTYAENTVLTYDLFREEEGHRVLVY